MTKEDVSNMLRGVKGQAAGTACAYVLDLPEGDHRFQKEFVDPEFAVGYWFTQKQKGDVPCGGRGRAGKQHSKGASPGKFTGTPLFVAYSLLAEGSNVHTESTHLESLYYSVWYSIAGKLPHEQVFRDSSSMRMWAAMRRGIMSGSEPLRGVKEEVRLFLWELRQLFWPGDGNRNLMPVKYKTDVNVDQFLAVCMNYM